MFSQYALPGLGLILIGVITGIIGLILVCIEAYRKSGLIVLLIGLASFIIGFTLCSVPGRYYEPYEEYQEDVENP